MTSTSLHPTPSSRAVAVEQFRAVGLALRTEAILFVSALLVLSGIIIANAIRFVQTHPEGQLQMGFTYRAEGVIPIFLVALLIPFGVWRSEDPSRRAYHWSMPVARGPHTIVKLLSGWLWMMIAVAVYLLCIIMLGRIIPAIVGEAARPGVTPGWEWVAAFTAATLGYLLTSIAVIASNHPWRWIGGLVIGYGVLVAVLNAFGMQEAGRALQTISDGAYGFNAALVGATQDGPRGVSVGMTRETMRALRFSTWLVAMPLWIIGSGIAVTIASYRHRE
jgi:hypothetical protein